jgi:hypothetical protein
MKIILEAKEIPIGSFITKINGSYRYKILDKIEVYDTDKNIKQNITPIKNDDCRFLIGMSSNGINIISSNTELVWHTTKEELIDFLNREIEEN